MTVKNLKDIVEKFTHQKILVLGDIILDKYIWCEVNRISPEAPVPVANVKGYSYVLGGSANVANNLKNLGADVILIGIVGLDHTANLLKSHLKNAGISDNFLIIDPNRPTTLKSRLVADSQQLVRIDEEVNTAIDRKYINSILKIIKNNLKRAKVLIISDYAKGLLTKEVIHGVMNLCEKENIKTLVDPTLESFAHFKRAYIIKPNKKEAEGFIKRSFADDYSNLGEIGLLLEKETQSKLVVTLGKDGIALLDDKEIVRIPTHAKEVFDVSGAGDTVISALALSISADSDLYQAVVLSNICAGIVVGKFGTSTCSQKELLSELDNYDGSSISRSRRNNY